MYPDSKRENGIAMVNKTQENQRYQHNFCVYSIPPNGRMAGDSNMTSYGPLQNVLISRNELRLFSRKLS